MSRGRPIPPLELTEDEKQALELIVEKVRDVVGLYMSLPQNALVLCVDEKSQIQALERSQPMLPLFPDESSGVATTTSAMARSRSSLHWT